MKLYTYCIRNDCGASPNPYGGLCSLALTKPVIRRSAKVGDWIAGLASPQSGLKDANRRIIFAMKVTQIMNWSEYNTYCLQECTDKIPVRPSLTYEQLVGDCIYEIYEGMEEPILRTSVHDESNIQTDLGGEHILLSDHFIYWGSEAPELPPNLWKIIKKGKGHQADQNSPYIKEFEKFVSDYDLNSIVAPPINKIEHWYCAESRGQCAEIDLEDNALDEKINS
jgi:hypothetical protein